MGLRERKRFQRGWGGVGWGWETGKDFKGGGAGGEQKSKREKDIGTTRK